MITKACLVYRTKITFNSEQLASNIIYKIDGKAFIDKF